MFKKTASRAAVVLICAAAFTFVAAQFSWESDFTPSAPAAPPPSQDSFPWGSPASSEPSGSIFDSPPPAPEPAAVAPASAAAPRTERPARTAVSGDRKVCPVCASVRVKDHLYAESNGRKIHVCSATCIGRVRRNPAAFAKILEKRAAK